jgi:hypothetical protein
MLQGGCGAGFAARIQRRNRCLFDQSRRYPSAQDELRFDHATFIASFERRGRSRARHRRRPARLRPPAHGDAGDGAGPLDDLQADCQRRISGAGTPWPSGRGLAMVGLGPVERVATGKRPHLEQPGRSLGQGRAQPGASQPLTQRAARPRSRGLGRLLLAPAPEPVRRRGHGPLSATSVLRLLGERSQLPSTCNSPTMV